jgi:hypothetical protein
MAPEQLPTEPVRDLCWRIRAELTEAPPTVAGLELAAFQATGTPHDARRLANVLLHTCDRKDLALEVWALVADSPH